MESSAVNYFIFDGDKIGDHIARSYLANDERMLVEFDALIRDRLARAAAFLTDLGYEMVACGADGITCKGEDLLAPSAFIELTQIVLPYTFSLGSGCSLRDAFISLRFAKANGRNSYARMDKGVLKMMAPESADIYHAGQ